jgi:hypothetical protein
LIDLHTHTNASDGLLAPEDLAARAAAGGVSVLSVTDHDTVAAAHAAGQACAARGIAFVPGIEITAIVDGLDVHVLGYFIDPASEILGALLADQRRSRFDRIREIVARLAARDIALDAEKILQPAIDDPGKAPGRPWVARALVAARHVANSDEAFARWLKYGAPGFVPRIGISPAGVVARIHAAGGIASLAHPGLISHDEWIPPLALEGLDAIEAYHSDHDQATTARYLAMASKLGVAVTGGSDYHGDHLHGSGGPGSVSLPRDRYEALVHLAGSRRLRAKG